MPINQMPIKAGGARRVRRTESSRVPAAQPEKKTEKEKTKAPRNAGGNLGIEELAVFVFFKEKRRVREKFRRSTSFSLSLSKTGEKRIKRSAPRLRPREKLRTSGSRSFPIMVPWGASKSLRRAGARSSSGEEAVRRNRLKCRSPLSTSRLPLLFLQPFLIPLSHSLPAPHQHSKHRQEALFLLPRARERGRPSERQCRKRRRSSYLHRRGRRRH